MHKPAVFERRRGQDTGRKRGTRKESALQANQASLPRQSEERGRERGRNRPARAQQWGRIHMVLPALE